MRQESPKAKADPRVRRGTREAMPNHMVMSSSIVASPYCIYGSRDALLEIPKSVARSTRKGREKADAGDQPPTKVTTYSADLFGG